METAPIPAPATHTRSPAASEAAVPDVRRIPEDVHSLEMTMTQSLIQAVGLTVRVNLAAAQVAELTMPEVRAITYLAEGLSQLAMSERERLTESGMSMRISRLRYRLDLKSTCQLISWAYLHGVLEVSRG